MRLLRSGHVISCCGATFRVNRMLRCTCPARFLKASRSPARSARSSRKILSPEALGFVAKLHRKFEPRRQELLARARAAAEGVRRRREAGFPRRNEEDPRSRLGRRPAAEGHARPARRDHRPDRPQDGDQRAQLRRLHLHGGLRGRQLPDLAQHDRRADQPARRGAAHDQLRSSRRQANVPPERQDRGAHPAAARLAPRREARHDRRQAGLRRHLRLRAVLLPQREGAPRARLRARTSTCRRWSRTSRRGCGTTFSSSRRRTWAFRTARSGPPR